VILAADSVIPAADSRIPELGRAAATHRLQTVAEQSRMDLRRA
jgi:hypothetical protein